MKSKIRFEALDKDTVKVDISPDAPVELVEHLTKSLSSKGLVEDAKRSTLSTRYFYRNQDNLNKIADDLIKSLSSLVKGVNTLDSHRPNTLSSDAKKIPLDASWTVRDSGARHSYINDKSEKLNNNKKKSILDFFKEEQKKDEDVVANKLAKAMAERSMLGFYSPSSDDMIRAGNQMGLGLDEQQKKAQEDQWNNTINNWLIEASKPISQRFSSEEEELRYWNSIKVSGHDEDDGSPGY